MLCQRRIIIHDSTGELVRVTLFFRVILYCTINSMVYPLVCSLQTVITVFWVVLRPPCVFPTCDATNDMFFITYVQDS